MYLTYIDGIRAIAVISVIIYHLNPAFLPGGFSGVDVFFVVSGFVVSLSLDKYKDVKFSEFIAIFYSRRIKRIIPALVFCLVISIFLSALFIPRTSLSRTHEKTALYALFGLSNIVLARGDNDYFGPIAEFNPFTHTWSLGVEEQFYVIFPFLFFLWTSSKNIDNKRKSSLLFGTFFIFSLCTCFYFSLSNKQYEYYSILSRFWELASGILLYQFIKSKFSQKFKSWTTGFHFLSLLGTFLLFVGLSFSEAKNFPIPWGFTVVFGTFLLLLSLNYIHNGFIRAFLENPFMTSIGKLSYSLYLWHWTVIVLFKWTVGLNTPYKIISVVVISFAMSGISYHFIETPVRRARSIAKLPRKAVIATGLVFLIFTSVAINIMFKYRENYTISISNDSKNWDSDDIDLGLDANKIICNPSVEKISLKAGKKIRNYCEPSDLNHRTIFMFGDSHAGAYGKMLKKYSAETGDPTVSYVLYGCGDMSTNPLDKLSEKCRDFAYASFEDISRQAKRGDIIFLASLKLPRFTEPWQNLNVEEAKENIVSKEYKDNRSLAVEDNIELLKPLTDLGVKVIYEAPKPIFKSPSYRCAKWFNSGNPICADGLEIDKQEMLSYRKPVMDSLFKIQSKMENTYIYDPLEALCPDDKCKAIDDGKPLFFDGDHLSGYGVLTVYDDFKHYLNNNDLSSQIALKN